jgi:hypothetical protein
VILFSPDVGVLVDASLAEHRVFWNQKFSALHDHLIFLGDPAPLILFRFLEMSALPNQANLSLASDCPFN